MGLFVKVLYIRKDNTKTERTIWERIDAEGEPGVWTTTDPINVMDPKYFEDNDMHRYRSNQSRKKKPQVRLNTFNSFKRLNSRRSRRTRKSAFLSKLSVVLLEILSLPLMISKLGTAMLGQILLVQVSQDFRIAEKTIFPALTPCEEILKADPKCSGKKCKSMNCIMIEPVELEPLREQGRKKAAYLPEMIIENFSPRGVFYDNERAPSLVSDIKLFLSR